MDDGKVDSLVEADLAQAAGVRLDVILNSGTNCAVPLPTPTPHKRGIPLLGGVGVGSTSE